MEFQVIPSIALKNGSAFFVYSQSKEDEPGVSETNLENAVELMGEKYGCVHILDIDGIEKDRPNYNLISDLSSVAEIWLECGSANAESVMDALITGAEYLVLGTRFLYDLDEFKEILELTENIFLNVEWNGRILSPTRRVQNMTLSELGREIKTIGIERTIFTDVERITGKTRSINYVAINDLVKCGVDVYASGGCTPGDQGVLERLKVRGMIVDAGLIMNFSGNGE